MTESYRSLRVLEVFFENFYQYRKNFLDQIFAKGKGKVDVSLSGAHLTGAVKTDFRTVWAKIIQEVSLEYKTDLLITIDDISVKVGIDKCFL